MNEQPHISPEQEEKNLERERMVFFCDAVVAIAITLLVFNLKVPNAGPHFTFADLASAWHQLAAFFLSFIIIAVFWINHHRFYVYIKGVDSKLITFNMCWLLFIVLLPFTTSLISSDFFNKPAMFIYSFNVLAVACVQNVIWDYATDHRTLLKDNTTRTVIREYRVGCNLAMGNALFAVALAFISPMIAFISLFARSFMFHRSAQKYVAHITKKRAEKRKLEKEIEAQPELAKKRSIKKRSASEPDTP